VFREFLRYNLVGIVNTVIGFGIILLLMYLGMDAVKSNAVGYGFGAVLSYVLNSKYTFKDGDHNGIKVFKFFLVLGVAYSLNYLVLKSILPLLNPYLAQMVSAIVYTVSAFVLMRLFIFDRQKPTEKS
jgi:putative flippase GtrA